MLSFCEHAGGNARGNSSGVSAPLVIPMASVNGEACVRRHLSIHNKKKRKATLKGLAGARRLYCVGSRLLANHLRKFDTRYCGSSGVIAISWYAAKYHCFPRRLSKLARTKPCGASTVGTTDRFGSFRGEIALNIAVAVSLEESVIFSWHNFPALACTPVRTTVY